MESKEQAIAACETFRDAVMLSVGSLPVSADLRADVTIRFQTFYLTVLTDLLGTVPPPSTGG